MTKSALRGGSPLDDEASADEHGDLDLSPRTSGSGGAGGAVIYGRRGGGGTRKWPWLVVLGVVVLGVGFVIFHAINDATVFYLNTDEAIARQSELGAKHFRMQGAVVEGSVHKVDQGTAFKVAYNGKEAAVIESGDPPQLFQDCIPVVLNGYWQGTGTEAVFLSDQIIVAHDSNYEEANSDRINAAKAQAKADGGDPSNACLMKAANETAAAPKP
jgi:cytochrome c-type biogenesis protein CcmE